MNEEEWLRDTIIDRLLTAATIRSSIRKFRLFSCACVRSLLPPSSTLNLQNGVEVAEQLADTTDNSSLLRSARNQVDFVPYGGSANQYLALASETTLSEEFYLVGRQTHRNLLNYINRAGLELPTFGLS